MLKEKKSALAKATDLLANQEQSSTMLKRKLSARNYSDAEINDAIAKLKKYNYLNDQESCKRQFEILFSEGKLSIRQIIAKLIRRGFDKDFIEKLIPNDADKYELSTANQLLEKKFSNNNFDRNKAWQFLSMRGFDCEIISSAIENFT